MEGETSRCEEALGIVFNGRKTQLLLDLLVNVMTCKQPFNSQQGKLAIYGFFTCFIQLFASGKTITITNNRTLCTPLWRSCLDE